MLVLFDVPVHAFSIEKIANSTPNIFVLFNSFGLASLQIKRFPMF